ncbi:MAG: nucleotide exchange factor GrpE [Candidatus Thermoplasmatota archaeon]|nr:nucleotide exchange factor GrpE [Candidatus Thermoplasmatota archaeon]
MGHEISSKVKANIWSRDDFSCRVCGRTLGWDELHIGYAGSDPESMITLCSSCVASKGKPIKDEKIAKLVCFLRDLDSAATEFEPEEGPDLERLTGKIKDLDEEIRFLREDNEKKLRMLITFKNRAESAENDYRNLKNRTGKEVELKVGMISRKLILGYASAIDDLDRAITNGIEIEGLIQIKKSMSRALEELGVEMIVPEGKFDPGYHEAVDLKVTEEEDGMILKVKSPGYIFEGKVIRPAQVVVAKNKEEEPEFEIIEDEEFEVRSAKKPIKRRLKKE